MNELEALERLINTNTKVTIKDALSELETYNNNVFTKLHNMIDILIAKNLCHEIKYYKE